MRRYLSRYVATAALTVSFASIPPVAAYAASAPSEVGLAHNVLLMDMNSGQMLYAKRADEPFLPASLTKVMTAWVAFEQIESGRLDKDAVFTVSPEIAAAFGGQGATLWLKPGDRVALDPLLRGITVVSANDAAAALAEGAGGSLVAWIAEMNRQAALLGMSGSRFASPNGLPDGGRTRVTATDLVRLADALIERHPASYSAYFGQPSFVWKGEVYRNRNPVLGVIAGADGIKTGHTAEAGYNFLGSAQRDGRRLIMVVAGAASEADRAAVSRALLLWGFSAWSAHPLFARGATVALARVQQGDMRTIPLVSRRRIDALLPYGTKQRVRLRLLYDGPLVAPVARGQKVAQLEVRVGNMAPGYVPLYAGREVGRAGVLDRLRNGLAHIWEQIAGWQ